MLFRYASACAVGAMLFAGPALAQFGYELDERQQMLMGGAPKGKAYSLWGIQAIPKANVSYPGKHTPGTIVIDTAERRLYLVQGDGTAIRYGIGVGREGASWAGTSTVSAKREWPDWTPTAEIIKRIPDVPRHMKGGPENPLGARALYLGGTLYRIHGSNEPETIGQAVSSGCIRLTNEDIIDLYNRVPIGATVIVQR